jgi:hypothetical protein
MPVVHRPTSAPNVRSDSHRSLGLISSHSRYRGSESECESVPKRDPGQNSNKSLKSSALRERVVVAIDPAVTPGEEADETGIVVAGKDKNGHGYVLADISGRYPADRVGPHGRSPPTRRTAPTASSPRSTTAATWSGRRSA